MIHTCQSLFHHTKTRLAAAVLIAAAAEAAAVWSLLTTKFRPGLFALQTLLAAGVGLLWMVRKEPGRKLQIFFFALTPAAAFYGLETFTHNPLKMELSPQIINLLLFWFFYIVLFAVLGSFKRALITGNILTVVVGIANHYTMEFRGNPILPWDLRSASTAASVMDNFTYTAPASMVFTLLLFLYLCILAEKCTLRAPAPKRRACIAAAGLCLLLAMKTALCTTAFTDRALTFSNLFTQWATYRDNGFAASFIQNTKYLKIDKPDRYSAEAIRQEAQTQKQISQAMAAKPSHTISRANPANPTAADQKQQNTPSALYSGNGETYRNAVSGNALSAQETQADSPNIIVIMNEAFSDLSVLHAFETNEDYMPFIHSLQEGGENTITGNLFVSVVGGNTANTEFEFLTGDSMAFLPSGSVPYQQYISEELPSLASSLQAEGYRTIAMHPYHASGWKRNEVYPLLGFDEAYFKPDFKNPEIIRKYVSDRSSYAKIKELYEGKAEGEKLFVFNVTMQNHSGYSEIFDDFPPTVSLTDMEKPHPATENYLTLIKESDAAFKELTEYFSAQEEPTVILMFGDHQPNDYVAECIASLTGVSQEERSLSESQNRFIVPFVMWANYDIEEQSSLQLSANYLGTLLLKTAGLPLTEWQSYLTRLSETLPVITANTIIDSEGSYIPISAPEDLTNQEAEALKQYQRFQYNHLFDQDNYPEGFFTR